MVYHHGSSGADIGGLIDGAAYYVNVQSDGKLKLYSTRADALAGKSKNLIDLTSVGSGAAHSLAEVTDTFQAAATSGAGGGMPSFDPSTLMRQVEQRPRPPHTEACGMPAIRLASNTVTPRTIWTTRLLG